MNPTAVNIWKQPSADVFLGEAEVHLWLADLDRPPSNLDKWSAVLSADEQTRGHRFHFERDRQRYWRGRAILRTLLGRYLGAEAEDVRFDYTAYGRPVLAVPFSGSRLCFNVAHTQGVFLAGVTRARQLGVDVEGLRPLPDAASIARRFFAAAEQAALSRLPTSRQERAFFDCWTRKEAYIKALGSGLSQPLDEFEVSFLPDEEPCLRYIKGKPAESCRWQLVALEPVPGYVAAVIADERPWTLTRFQFAG